MCVCVCVQKQKLRRVKAIYNCNADNPDELTFSEGEVIVVNGEEDQEWWVSELILKTHTVLLTHRQTPQLLTQDTKSCF